MPSKHVIPLLHATKSRVKTTNLSVGLIDSSFDMCATEDQRLEIEKLATEFEFVLAKAASIVRQCIDANENPKINAKEKSVITATFGKHIEDTVNSYFLEQAKTIGKNLIDTYNKCITEDAELYANTLAYKTQIKIDNTKETREMTETQRCMSAIGTLYYNILEDFFMACSINENDPKERRMRLDMGYDLLRELVKGDQKKLATDYFNSFRDGVPHIKLFVTYVERFQFTKKNKIMPATARAHIKVGKAEH